MAERPHRHAGETVRQLLHNADLPPSYWPYALVHWALLWNLTAHRTIEITPYEALTSLRPNLSCLRVFGAKIFVSQPGDRDHKFDHHITDGIFLGYTASLTNILFVNTKTNRLGCAKHATFDEANFTRQFLTPGAQRLAQATGRDPTNFCTSTASIQLDLYPVQHPYLDTIRINFTYQESATHGFRFHFDENRGRIYVLEGIANSPSATVIRKYKRIRMSWLLTVHGLPIHEEADIADALATVPDPSHAVEWIFAPDRTRKRLPTQEDLPHLNIDQLASIARTLARVHQKLDLPSDNKFDVFHDIDLEPGALSPKPPDFSNPTDFPLDTDVSASQPVSDAPLDDPTPRIQSTCHLPDLTISADSDPHEPLDQYETHELRRYILAIRKGPKAQQQHLKAKALTRRSLQKQSDRPEWQAAEFKMLDQYADVDMYGTPVPRTSIPKGAKILKSLWCYVVKPDGRKKARNVCNGRPNRAFGKVKITFAETYAASLSQLELRLFWAIAARCNWIAYGADATNAFAFPPPPQGDTVYMQADPQYVVEWYNKRHPSAQIDANYVLPVQHALQGHPESFMGGSYQHKTCHYGLPQFPSCTLLVPWSIFRFSSPYTSAG